jgi:hypothetical protein
MDTAGRAVECILRAYFFRRNGLEAKLEAGHDLVRLFKASGFEAIALETRRRRGDTESEIDRFRQELSADINSLAQRWSNDLRYTSESRLGAELRRKHLHRGVKGDYVRFNAQQLVEAARRLVARGVERWSRSRRN